jgi:exopolysaccharide biosynthesis WecB/TagA/CpsF family protein
LFRFGADVVRITHADRVALLAAVADRLAAGRGFALATINLDHLVKLRGDAAFRRAYAAQDMVVADGNPVVWLSRLAGRPVGLVPGADLVLPLVRAAVAAGRPVAIVGATEGALQGAVAHLAVAVPGFRAGPLIAPPRGFDPEGPEARAILGRVAAAGPCLCLVALGAPKQERLAALGRGLAPQAGFAGIGAGVDFLSGVQARAPGWLRAVALEWLWRMLREPRRMVPRYAACAAILPVEAARALRLRRGA